MDVNKVNANAFSQEASFVNHEVAKLQTKPETVQAVTAVNDSKFFGQDSELTFAMDRETRRTVIRLVDRKTRTVIRQIPEEYLLRLSQDLKRNRV